VPASLQDAAVVVIGGSSGIGLETARLALARGARVTIVGRDQGRLDAARADLGSDVATVALDVADEARVAALFESIEHVDHLATFAGTHVNGRLADVETSALRGPVDNRFWGPLFLCKYAAPKMTTGSITICTGAGVGRPRAGASIVGAAAGASELLARSMSLELAPIRVNVVRPGIVDTPLFDRMAGEHKAEVLAAQAKRIPLKRVAQPEEIAHAVEFLMTNEYVTGSTLTIDGGFSNA
jgi:NAD(P)-dependent dehydrogenase (short-subunit alcohol dehydrogenase family)